MLTWYAEFEKQYFRKKSLKTPFSTIRKWGSVYPGRKPPLEDQSNPMEPDGVDEPPGPYTTGINLIGTRRKGHKEVEGSREERDMVGWKKHPPFRRNADQSHPMTLGGHGGEEGLQENREKLFSLRLIDKYVILLP
jgi:hypothetical protein